MRRPTRISGVQPGWERVIWTLARLEGESGCYLSDGNVIHVVF